jgi:hypothetical protein
MIDESDHAPTASAEELYLELARQVEAAQARLRSIVAGEVAGLVAAIRAEEVPPIV